MLTREFTQDEVTDFVANFLPSGKALESKFCEGTSLRKYLKGKSVEFKRFIDLYNTHLEELDPRTTTIYLEEWESTLGIPDNCIPLASTVQDRRDNIVLKLSSLSIQTQEDVIALGLLFGFTIKFDDTDGFPYTFPMTFPDGSSCGSGFPFTFPFILGSESSPRFLICIQGDFNTNPTKATTFQCLIRELAPVGYKVVFVNT